MNSIELREKIASLVRLMAKRDYPHPAKMARITIEFIDGEEMEYPVVLVVTPHVTRDKQAVKSDKKQRRVEDKIMDFLHTYNGDPLTARALCSKSGCTWNSRFRTTLAAIVRAGKIIADKGVYWLFGKEQK